MKSIPHSVQQFALTGWCCSSVEAKLESWVDGAKPHAQSAMNDPAQAHWWRHGNSWFAGVNALPNDRTGRVADGPALPESLAHWVSQYVFSATPQVGEATDIQWERAQISVLRPGYPQRDSNESEAAHRFRRHRDAAHVDGLLPVGPNRRRMAQEFHGFILGIPLQNYPAHAGPTVVWEGSHRVIQRALVAALGDIPPEHWPQTDITDIYQQARRQVFEQCPRVEILVPVGACYLIHRLAVHGVAPWEEKAGDENATRTVCFFRPEIENRMDWLQAP